MTRIVMIDAVGAPPAPELVGAKAAALARMAVLGLPVPPAFVLPTTFCAPVIAEKASALADLSHGLKQGIAELERRTGLVFGDRRRPLLVSVRSGAAVSMPGMLDTVLNVGCTRTALRGLLRWRGHPRFAWDCRRRLIEGYAETVLGLEPGPLEARLSALMSAEQAASDRDLDGEALERLCASYESELADRDLDLPDDPLEQLSAAARAVFASWNSDRATAYRRLQGFDDLVGTAVTVQAMVFGNADARSAAGVAFSRDPSTGAPEPVVDALFEAQGEDVVSGRRSPVTEAAFALRAPEAAAELRRVLGQVETAFADVQDVEFTVESGRFYVLQTRAAKRTRRAALRIALDLLDAGLITAAEALARLGEIDPQDFAITRFAGDAQAVARGEPAAPGVASGRIALDSATAAGPGPSLLVRRDTSTEDVEGFHAASAILTALGGRTAHAALIARQMNKPCVVGCDSLRIDLAARTLTLAGRTLHEGDWLSINGDTGEIFLGRREIVSDLPQAELDRVRGLKPRLAKPDDHKTDTQACEISTLTP